MRPGGAGDQRESAEVVTAQLGRAPRGAWAVAVSCPFGFPAAVETAPYLADGTPFPTLFYLTCPAAVDEVARREAAGGVEAFRRAVADDHDLARAFAALDLRQRRRRRELAGDAFDGRSDLAADGGAVLERGIGGPGKATRATCLHAYTATLLAAVAGVLGGAADDAPQGGWKALLGDVERLWCHDARCVGFLPGRWERHAAIDVGTNSVRSLVAAIGTWATVGRPAGRGDLVAAAERKALLSLVRRARITRLGAGLVPGGALDPAARQRTEKAVRALVAEARALGARDIHLVGTSAARDALDGRDFIAELGRELGIAARVATGAEEAVLSFRGATRGLAGDPVVLDIGGGSTELVREQRTPVDVHGAAVPGPDESVDVVARRASAGVDRRTTHEVDAISLDLGCVRGTTDWFTSDPPPMRERLAARQACAAAFRLYAGRFGAAPTAARGLGESAGAGEGSVGSLDIDPDRAARTPRFIGVAGTITTLACLALDLPEYDPDAIHLRTFARTVLEEVVDTLAAVGPEERAGLPCMQSGRAGVIVAGGEILLGAMDGLGWAELTVSERDILDGILLAETG